MSIEIQPTDSGRVVRGTPAVRRTADRPTSSRDQGRPVVVEAAVEIDLDSVDVLAADLDDALREAGARRAVLVNLTATRFVGTAGLKLFLDVHARCAARGTTLRLIGADATVLRLLEVGGVTPTVPVGPAAAGEPGTCAAD